MGHTMYVPFISSRQLNPKSGIACNIYNSSDLLNISWYHFWGPANSDPRCVPMSYYGNDPKLSPDYSGYLIVYNEPDVNEIYSGFVTPSVAAERYNILTKIYPNCKMIVGNTTSGGLWWLREFKSMCESKPYAWGIHMYSDNVVFDPYELISQMEAVHSEIGDNFWFTEWADAHGNIDHDDILLDWLDKTTWVERWAYYTNRATGKDPWWIRGWKPQLWNMDGTLTDVGNWWARRIS